MLHVGAGGSMDSQNNDYGKNMPYFNGGELSASRDVKRKPVQRPSMDELAPYSTVNYTARGSKGARRQVKHRRMILAAIAAAIVVLLVIPGIALAVSAKNAMDDARTLMSQGSVLIEQIQSGDVQGAQRTAINFNSVAKQLDSNVNSILWKPLKFIPVYGNDIKSVRSLATVANALSEDLLLPLAENLPSDGNTRLLNGSTVNVPMLQLLLNAVGGAGGTIDLCTQIVESMPDPNIEQLQQPIAQVKTYITVLDEVSGYATELSAAIPGLLGVNGVRTYLVIACSQSELRSVGGFPGSAGLMTIDNGTIDVGEMDAPVVPFVEAGDPVLPLTAEEVALFGARSGGYFYDGGFNPHFPRAAEIMKSIWEAKGRQPIDGIISVDPVFLQRILALIGGVTTSDGVVVDGTNAAEMLMNTAYIMYSEKTLADEIGDSGNAIGIVDDRQNAFFSEVASLALDSFFANIGSADILKTLQMLGESIGDKRIYMWVSNPGEEAALEKLDAACALSTSEENPELGVYLATTLSFKGYWYIQADTSVGEGRKNADGSYSYSVTTTITNTLTPELAAELPVLVTSYDDYARGKQRSTADMILDLYLFAPVGGSITDVHTEGYFPPADFFNDSVPWTTPPGVEPMTLAQYNGHEVWYGVTALEPQQSTTVAYTVTTSPLALTPLVVDATPLGQE